MKIGLIGRMDNTGLGNQTWEFYRHIGPHNTMVIDLSDYNGMQQYPERYPLKAHFVRGIPKLPDIISFVKSVDIIFTAETPYNYQLLEVARRYGVKTVVQYNYEFFDYFAHPELPKPDVLYAPSRWHYLEIEKWCEEHDVRHVYMPCPVNRKKIPLRDIKQARRFIHIQGKAASHDRNGTEIVEAAKLFLKTNADIEIISQGDGRGVDNYEDLYKEGDVLILPRRYGGNCLPMHEALSAGMPVIMPDIMPNNSFLPIDWLVPSFKLAEFTPRTTIDIFAIDPAELAEKIDDFYRMDQSEFKMHHEMADQLANKVSWDTWAPVYMRDLCQSVVQN